MLRVFQTGAMVLGVLLGSAVATAQSTGVDAAPTPPPQQSQPAPASDNVAQPASPPVALPTGGTIRGTVKAGAVPLPGVAITATNTLTGKKYATTTDITGAYAMAIPRNGRYVVKTELAAFAGETQEVLINATGENGGKPEQVADFTMQLASRVEQQQQQQQRTTSTALAGAIGRGMQSLNVTGGASDQADASAGTGNTGAQMPSLAGLGNDSTATDSVAVSGQMGQTNGLANFNEDEIRQRVEDALARARQQGGSQGDIANAVAGMLGGMMVMGPGGGGPGGPGGPGGGVFMIRGGGGGGKGGRGFNPTQPHGAIFYQGGNGALDATNFSLTGAPVVKPSYSSNRFGISFAGSPFIPGLFKASTKQFIFFNVTEQRNSNPQNLYGTVPTVTERSGDFSQLGQPIYDPATQQQFQCNGTLNVICQNRISPQALSLLKFYPAPNIPTTGAQGYNYQTITTAGQNSGSASLRYVRNFGQNAGFGPFGGGFGGGRRQANAPKTLRQNINFGGSYSHSASDNRNIFLPLGGSTASDGYNISAGYTIGYGRLTNNATVTWNRSHATTLNYFTNGNDNPAVDAGILVGNSTIAGNPFYYGVPSLTFTGLTALSSTRPSDAINETISFSDFVSWSYKKHNLRFGGDIRRVHVNSLTAPGNLQSGASPLGAFTFTGYATQQKIGQSSTGGFGFADFLLGLPQQATVQAGLNKTYLRANVFDLYANDDWRVLPNLSLNYGLRYEYFSPYVEKSNRLVNLDHSADFKQIAAVQPGQTGPFSGTTFPRSLVSPDRIMFSPRFGFAYRPKGTLFTQMVVRGGYGINYNTQQYASFAQQLAFQPPFAVTQTNIANNQGCGQLQLANAFNCSTAAVQNNYSVNLNYRLGNVQVWNLDIQRTLGLGIVLNVGYNGAQGGNLDIVRAPNRTASSVLNPTVQPFNYEDSLGFSRFHALSINARKRMQKGVSLQATYQYGHSIDNASSIGGSTAVPAQNDTNLAAEEGNSSFDIRQKLTGNWVLELPFGPNRALLSKGGFWSKALDGFSLSGDFTFATGTYYTPHYVATVAETATGTNNSLRPDRDFAQPIPGAGTVLDWFNAAAFKTPANVFGTASRGSIAGPGTVAVDGSLAKTVSLGDTRSFEARVTANNVFNTVQYSGIDTTLNSRTFGQVTSAASMRRITFLARYRF